MSQRFTHGLMLVIAGLLAANLLRAPDAGVARADTLNGGGSDIFALVAPGNGAGNNVLYVIDPKDRRLAVYDDTARGQLQLRCVRNVGYELRLEAFPKEPKKMRANKRVQIPSVRAMKKLVGP